MLLYCRRYVKKLSNQTQSIQAKGLKTQDFIRHIGPLAKLSVRKLNGVYSHCYLFLGKYDAVPRKFNFVTAGCVEM